MDSAKNPKSYAGFTIGPIIESMKYAKKTREIWFASYFFSWYMETIISNLRENGKIDFLSPYAPKSNKKMSLAGIYPDRFVAKSNDDVDKLFDRIKSANEDTLRFFAGVIADLIKQLRLQYLPETNIDTIRNILQDYLQTDFVVLPADEIKEEEAVGTFFDYLDTLEENRSFTTGKSQNTCYLCKSLPGIVEITDKYDKPHKQNRCPLCLLKTRCNDSLQMLSRVTKQDEFHYPSTREIACADFLYDILKENKKIPKVTEKKKEYRKYIRDLEKKDEELNPKDDEFLGIVKHNKNEVKPYHKYFAIFQADGDLLSKLAAKIKNPHRLSEMLFRFAEEAVELVKAYKGEPIYFGGDDVLAFLPAAVQTSEGLKTILDFAHDISTKYCDILNIKLDSGKKASISMGISIVYHKHPLSIAAAEAWKLLRDVAKEKRNTTAIKLTKHSGASVQLVFGNDSDELEEFSKVFRKALSNEITIPGSLHYSLARYETLFLNADSEPQIESIFENCFDEDIHGKGKVAEGLEMVRDLFIISFKFAEGITDSIARKKAFDSLLGQLKFIKFFGDEDD